MSDVPRWSQSYEMIIGGSRLLEIFVIVLRCECAITIDCALRRSCPRGEATTKLNHNLNHNLNPKLKLNLRLMLARRPTLDVPMLTWAVRFWTARVV